MYEEFMKGVSPSAQNLTNEQVTHLHKINHFFKHAINQLRKFTDYSIQLELDEQRQRKEMSELKQENAQLMAGVEQTSKLLARPLGSQMTRKDVQDELEKMGLQL